jgi:integrase/recombinase XerC
MVWLGGLNMSELVPAGEGAPLPLPLSSVAADLYSAVLAGRNARTVQAYAGDYADFARFLGVASPGAALDALIALPPGQAHALAIAYRASLVERKLAAATIARRLAALRSAVKLARQLGRVSWSLEVEPPAVSAYRDTAGPGPDGWRRILDAAKAAAHDGTAKGLRDLALVRLLHDLALRRAEVLALDLADVELAGPRPVARVVRKGQTDPQPLTLPRPVVSALSAWVAVRGDAPGPLFVRLDRAGAGRLTGHGLEKLLRRMGQRAGLSRRLRPHGLRHAGITTALDRTGGDVRAVARFSGHKKLDTLLIYDDNRRDLGGQVAGLVSDD